MANRYLGFCEQRPHLIMKMVFSSHSIYPVDSQCYFYFLRCQCDGLTGLGGRQDSAGRGGQR